MTKLTPEQVAEIEGRRRLPPLIKAGPSRYEIDTDQVERDFKALLASHASLEAELKAREPAWEAGRNAAAKLIEDKCREYVAEHGSYDPSTGATGFSNVGEEYVMTLEELAEDIRAIIQPPKKESGR